MSLTDGLIGHIIAVAIASAAKTEGAEIVRVSCVCKRWRAIVASSAEIWRKWAVTRFPRLADSVLSSAEGTDWRSLAKRSAMAARRKALNAEMRRALAPMATPGVPHLSRAIKALSIDWRGAPRINGSSMSFRVRPADCKCTGQVFSVRAVMTATNVRLNDIAQFTVVARSRILESDCEFTVASFIVQQQQQRQRQPQPQQQRPFVEVKRDENVSLWQASDTETGGNVILGLFRTGEVAFFCTSVRCLPVLHSVWNKAAVPSITPHQPVFDDVDSRYGLHGYSVQVTMRNMTDVLWEETFRDMTAEVVVDRDGSTHVDITLVERNGEIGHIVPQRPSLPWSTDAFDNTVAGVAIVDVTVLDEHGEAVWVFTRLASFSSETSDGRFGDPEGSSVGWQFVQPGRGSFGMVLTDYGDEHQECAVVSMWVGLDSSWVSQWFGRQIVRTPRRL